MLRRHLFLASTPVFLAAALTLSACGSSGSGALSPATALTPGMAASASSAGTMSPAGTPVAPASSVSAVAVALDPCQVVTSQEASVLAGASFSKGLEEDTGAGKRCTYGSGTTNVLWVQLAQAANASEADAQWSTYQAEAMSALASSMPGIGTPKPILTNQSGLGDRAATATWSATLSGLTLHASDIFVIKGAAFVGFGDLVLTKPAPSVAALKAQARTSIGRLP